MKTPHILAALSLAALAAAPASAQSVGATFWSSNGGGCTPTDATLRADQYWTVTGGGRVKYRSAAVGTSTLNFVCPITGINPGVQAGDATHMRLYYQDPDGEGAAFQVRATLRSFAKSNGAYRGIVCQVTSNATGAWRIGDERCPDLDFGNNLYWVEVIVSRTSPSPLTVEFNGVELVGVIE